MYNALSCNNFLIHTYIAKGYTIYSHSLNTISKCTIGYRSCRIISSTCFTRVHHPCIILQSTTTVFILKQVLDGGAAGVWVAVMQNSTSVKQTTEMKYKCCQNNIRAAFLTLYNRFRPIELQKEKSMNIQLY